MKFFLVKSGILLESAIAAARRSSSVTTQHSPTIEDDQSSSSIAADKGAHPMWEDRTISLRSSSSSGSHQPQEQEGARGLERRGGATRRRGAIGHGSRSSWGERRHGGEEVCPICGNKSLITMEKMLFVVCLALCHENFLCVFISLPWEMISYSFMKLEIRCIRFVHNITSTIWDKEMKVNNSKRNFVVDNLLVSNHIVKFNDLGWRNYLNESCISQKIKNVVADKFFIWIFLGTQTSNFLLVKYNMWRKKMEYKYKWLNQEYKKVCLH